MARYIDADKIVFWIRHVSSNGMLCDTDVRKVAFSDEIARIPTADVATRAEVERLERILTSYALQYGTVVDQQKVIDAAKQEVAKEIFEVLDEKIYQYIPDLYTLEIYKDLKKKYTEEK